MPVIINETEIVVEPPPVPAPSMPAAASPSALLTPEEVLRVIRRHEERIARVWAD
jgi:hypothetical protein